MRITISNDIPLAFKPPQSNSTQNLAGPAGSLLLFFEPDVDFLESLCEERSEAPVSSEFCIPENFELRGLRPELRSGVVPPPVPRVPPRFMLDGRPLESNSGSERPPPRVSP